MSYSSYRVSFGTSQTCLRVQGRLEAWKFRGLEAWLSRWGSAPHPYNSSVARLPGALFSVAVEGLALRACTLCSPFSGAALAAPPPSNQPVAKKHLHLGGICCYSIVTHWVSQCNGLCKRTKDIVRNVGTTHKGHRTKRRNFRIPVLGACALCHMPAPRRHPGFPRSPTNNDDGHVFSPHAANALADAAEATLSSGCDCQQNAKQGLAHCAAHPCDGFVSMNNSLSLTGGG